MSEDSSQPKISHRKKARNLLVQALYQWQLADGSSSDIEAQFRADNAAKIDWDFFHQALVHIITNTEKVDQTFADKLDRKLNQIDPIELALLRLGSLEFSERIDVPYKVVINEYVDLAKKYGATDSYKYINGVLDKLARDLRALEINRTSES
ncbi:transcription antitermination factor NusB [Haliea sp. AH-315-K21]|uniref:Transcription antitermination protein NusB n=1 Tax=SAR86 cluster bacterium TaxID=2030880 RepID=A0A2A5CEC0_9GAMM|nr:transcription antitermination factor NusB [Haliea sp. AH-315-K21]MBN4059816.1 transcription antitermination factor NusB [bacterium AH-315-I11]MBN4075519.1 transcription antitermination factor NusB [Gammaproteobacteria bacterium AH-315-E17]PCJ41810.1 MAG: transcription antitermination factor NusB [SAR86 cluster bacterium]